MVFGLGLACQAKGRSCRTKNQPLPKHFRKKKMSKSAKYRLPLCYKGPIKITIYLGLDIIIKLKFTTNFYICVILNLLNCLTKSFEH